MSNRRQRGFSLLELMVAMMIIGVLATLGFKGYIKYTATARYTQAQNHVKIMSDGLDAFYIQRGKYPEGLTWDALISADSPLVKGNMIPPNMPAKDPWDQPYEVLVQKGSYTVTCKGDPGDLEARPEFSRQPGKLATPGGGGGGGAEAKPEAKEGAGK